ncbi:lysozyme inhibitor LprI family protein [Seohaeicola sp. SP36]|uniref:lysozyme inhibitor LprI family protein n=1 Tax=unclassified Seohaeicola TaxID=2641111 RepID=UPI003D80A69A
MLPAPVVHAQASFDCSLAATPVEITICAHDELSRLDREMAAAYRSARGSAGQGRSDQVLADQRAWIVRRDACGPDRNCLSRLMRDRIATLSVSTPAQNETSLMADNAQRFQYCLSSCWRNAELVMALETFRGRPSNMIIQSQSGVLYNCQQNCHSATAPTVHNPSQAAIAIDLNAVIRSNFGTARRLQQEIRSIGRTPWPTKISQLPNCRPRDVTCQHDNDWCGRVPPCR